VSGDGSPYTDANAIPYPEFLWALNTVSSRHIVLHDHQMDSDPNLLLMMMPLLDLLNHSPEPNVAIRPHVDRTEGESFLVLQALRDIQPDEQLTVSYGGLSNMHLI
jgi:SET domain-containing protein